MKYLLTYEKLNESRSIEIDKDKFFKLLDENCPNFNFTDPPIYRGIESIEKTYYKINPSNFKRKSANTENYYTLIFDNSPYLGEYPKRSKSIVCSRNYDSCIDFGNVYRVIPYDNCKIAETFHEDFWYSFYKIDNLCSFNVNLSRRYYLLNIDNDKPKTLSKDKEEFFKQLKELENNNNLPNGFKTLDELFKAFSPYENGFKLYKNYNEFRIQDIIENKSEIWTNSPSLLLKI